jgi:hypothetical protein
METCTETQVLRKSYLFEELGKYTNWEELDYIYSTVNYFSGNFKGVWQTWKDIQYHPYFQVSCECFQNSNPKLSPDWNLDTTEKNPLQVRDDNWSFPKG